MVFFALIVNFNAAADGGKAVQAWNGLTWFKSAYSDSHVSSNGTLNNIHYTIKFLVLFLP